ncbi:MAG: hypothetical protein HYX34_08490 [Actinobacteria bacterium]|nr:hypothetical protein [Actinomycetota bacterium]
MGRYEELVVASVERLATEGWVVGPPLEAEEWRRRIKAAARQEGWKLATGVGTSGYPWAARTDLDDERGTPWHRLGMLPRSFFEMYGPEGLTKLL